MCGIAGWYNRDRRPVDERVLIDMRDQMVHRGPDDHGLWIGGHVGLAHRRLAIRDLSPVGRQPMSDSEQRIVVTYNGEIYNDRALRTELERDFGFVFRTSCDTEVLPYAYLAWGDEMFSRLEGMYAIALWDAANDRLVLARDGIGIKPLLFAAVDKAVIFASEMKGILASRIVGRTLAPERLNTFFSAGHAGPCHSLLSDVEQVPPGTIVSFSGAERRQHCFWRPQRTGDIVDRQPALDAMLYTLDEVIGDQLVSDVPLGVLQSGGIDSSLISLSVGRKNIRAPLFTASFDDPSHDEVELARGVARSAGLPHCVVPVDTSSELAEKFRSLVHHFDGQCADTGALGFFVLAGAVRKHTTVVLSGDGGDEFFCGYETYAATRLASLLRPFTPAPLARTIGNLMYSLASSNEQRLPWTAVAARFASGMAEGGRLAHLEWRRLVPAALTKTLYGPAMRELVGTSPYQEYATYYNESPGSLLDKAMLADQRFHLQSVLTKVDAMSMAHSLEVRVPLLDRRIMDLAGRIPVKLLNRWGGQPKELLRMLALRLGASTEVTSARKKGFNVPISRLLRGELSFIANRVLESEPDVLQPYLNADSVRELWRAHRDRRANHAFALWPILILGVWLAGMAKATPIDHAFRRAAPEGLFAL